MGSSYLSGVNLPEWLYKRVCSCFSYYICAAATVRSDAEHCSISIHLTQKHKGCFKRSLPRRGYLLTVCFPSSRISQRLQRKEPWHRFTAEAKLPFLPSSRLTPPLNSLCAPPVLPLQHTSSFLIRQPLLFYPPPITPSLHYPCFRALALLVFAADLATALRCSRGRCINPPVFVSCVLPARCLSRRAFLGLSRTESHLKLRFTARHMCKCTWSTWHLSITATKRRSCFAA